MGFLDRLFGDPAAKLPALDAESEVAERLRPFAGRLEEFAGDVRDHLEAVPDDGRLFVLVGHPPKEFGVLRYTDGQEDNLIQRMREAKLSPGQMQAISDQARRAYLEHQEADRFHVEVGRKAVTVIDSAPLGEKLDAVFAAAQA